MTGSPNFVRDFIGYQSKSAGQRAPRLRQSVLNIVYMGFYCLESFTEGRGNEIQIKLFPVRPIFKLSDKGVQVFAVVHSVAS